MSDSRDEPSRGHVELRGLTKRYGTAATAVENLSLSLSKGELLVLVGPSGCGKSTTLRCIAGLEDPSEGDVRIAGESVVGATPEERAIAMVFQNYALYPHKTARENIGFGLKMTTDRSSEAIDREVGRVADTLGIDDLLEKKPKSLSGGQQQRVALGRAIVRDPEVFLLDEPLSNLDATLRSRMRTEIQELQRSLDVTTVYVTHDQTEAMTIGDRIAVLRDGRLQQVAEPMACYRRPANRFVASFIGEPSMNFFECRVDAASSRLDGPIAYPATDSLVRAARDAAGGRVVLGIRPESVTLGGDTATFEGRVDLIEPVGERSLLYVSLRDGPTVTASVPGDVAVAETDRLTIGIPPRRVHLFDADTGTALRHPTETPGDGGGPTDRSG